MRLDQVLADVARGLHPQPLREVGVKYALLVIDGDRLEVSAPFGYAVESPRAYAPRPPWLEGVKWRVTVSETVAFFRLVSAVKVEFLSDQKTPI